MFEIRMYRRWALGLALCLAACATDAADGLEEQVGNPNGQSSTENDGDATGGGHEGSYGDEGKTCQRPDPGFEGPPRSGAQAPHWNTGIDSSGDRRDLCEFHGKPIMIDIVAPSCRPCRDWGAFLAGDESGLRDSNWPEDIIQDVFIPVRDLVDDGELVWVTVMFKGAERDSLPTAEDAAAWEDAFPADMVEVWADPDVLWFHHVYPEGTGTVPAFLAIDHEFDYLTDDPDGEAFTEILGAYGPMLGVTGH